MNDGDPYRQMMRANQTEQVLLTSPNWYNDASSSVHMLPTLTVSDAVELAKAGVKMEWKEIVPHLIRERHEVVPQPYTPEALTQRLRDRMQYNASLRYNPQDYYMANGSSLQDYVHVNAVLGKDVVHVFAGVPDAGKMVILQDDINLFPSDGLLTSIHLLRESVPAKEAA